MMSSERSPHSSPARGRCTTGYPRVSDGWSRTRLKRSAKPMLPKQRRHKRLQGVPVLGGPRGLIDLLDLRRLVFISHHTTRASGCTR